MLSVVRVPVLSKQQTSTFPAKGIRKGSVQNTSSCASARSEELTARANCMGSWGGMTDVMIRTQCNSNLYWSRSSSSIPLTRTYPDATKAKTSRNRIKNAASHESADTFSVDARIVLNKTPCEEEYPVRRTKQTQPLSGAFDVGVASEMLAEVCVSIRVPPKRTCALSSELSRSSRLASRSGRGAMPSFISGTDSPVSMASLTTAPPLRIRQSQGTTISGVDPLVSEMMSPGSSSRELMDTHFFPR
mmetsp:Transcript_40507/g.160728  ORF Transcript_40507/g.160728 Transcript_40507/m.160728 type:complete len:246 (+) Transcript_40507:3070-3807(+)